MDGGQETTGGWGEGAPTPVSSQGQSLRTLQAQSKPSINVLFLFLLGIIWGGSAIGKAFCRVSSSVNA